MAERGAPKYFHPTFDPKVHGTQDKFMGVHHLGARAKKINQGILVIRFETPFNFWCLGCDKHVAKGVRYNAEKKTVGNYFSTKILEFKVTCHLCGHVIKFQTDPKGCDYVITEGGRKKVETFDAESAEMYNFTDKETKKRLANDPIAKLEHVVDDKNKATLQKERLDQIEDIQSRNLNDFSMSQLVRKKFRIEKKIIKEEEKEATRVNLPMKLLPGRQEDSIEADNQLFENVFKSAAVTQRANRAKLTHRPIFESSKPNLTQELYLKKIKNNISSKILGSSRTGVSSLSSGVKSVAMPKLESAKVLVKRKVIEPEVNAMSLLKDYD